MQRTKSRIGYPPRVAKILIPPTPVAGGPLTVRFEGPFAPPAPVLVLRVDGDLLIARSYAEDFALPGPPVPYVEATNAAPAAGEYVLVDERCDGLPPPPLPVCTQAVLQGFTVAGTVAIPATGAWAAGCLLLAVAALAAQRIERALTALERLRV